MRWRRALTWLAYGALPLALLWVAFAPRAQARDRDQSTDQAVARVIAAQLDGFLAAHAAVLVELAERFSQWETLPAPAVLDSLRGAATRHLSLRKLLVADGAGRLVAGYDTDRPPGQEGLPSGSLDSVLGRRDSLRSTDLVVASQTRAGTVERLELAAPIRRTDGTRQGYVGASVSLRGPRRLLRNLAAGGLAIRVTDGQGGLVFPCRGPALTGGTTFRSGQFCVTVIGKKTGRSWSLVLALALALALSLLLVGLRVLRVLDRRR